VKNPALDSSACSERRHLPSSEQERAAHPRLSHPCVGGKYLDRRLGSQRHLDRAKRQPVSP